MRVLCVGNMYPPHHLGGYELMWRSAVSCMRGRGHQVRILTTDFRLDSPDPAIAEDQDADRTLRWYWKDHGFPLLGRGDRRDLERHNAAVLERQLKDFRPDVVSWWAMGGMSLSLIDRVRVTGVPAAGVVVDDWMVYGPEVDQSLGRGRPDLGAAGEWVFVSERTREAAIGAGWKLPRTSIAHGGVDATRFKLASEQEWGGRLLYVGRIDPRKGIDVAVKAVALVPGASLRVIGGGDSDHLASLQALVADLEIEGDVRFERRPRSEIPGAYADADAVLFPVQWEEPWGLVPLEAMAVGRPVVATGVGGSGEYLRDGANCLIYEPADDPEALAAAVKRLAEDHDLRTALRARGLETTAKYTEAGFDNAVADAVERALA